MRRAGIIIALLPVCVLMGDVCSAQSDPTTDLKLTPGMDIVFPIRQGIDTRRKPLGDYDFTVHVVDTAKGYKYDWQMNGATSASGTRTVTAADEKSAHGVSLFYDQRRDGTILGSTNIVRVSDDVYQAVKAGETIGFRLDGPEKLYSPDGGGDPLVLPKTITGAGEEEVYIVLNGERTPVRAVKAQTDNGWTYWILDNPDFPVMVAGAGPFYWQEPRFTLAATPPPTSPPPAAPADSEAKRVTKDLQDKGVATTRAILFAFDSDKLTDRSKQIVQAVGQYLTANPTVRLEIQGHTDNMGGFDYNMNLSRRRAESVQKYLVDTCKISASRLTARGFGFTIPVADNATDKGRALNRRVVFRRL